MDNKQLLGALAMDLKRAALGLHGKSYTTADKFFAEAMKRKSEINPTALLPYMQKILDNIQELKNQPNEHKAENALMYSTRIQNYNCINNKSERLIQNVSMDYCVTRRSFIIQESLARSTSVNRVNQ